MPMVRRAAATNLGKFAATIESAHLKTDIMSMFEDLTQDGMFSNIVWFCFSSKYSYNFRQVWGMTAVNKKASNRVNALNTEH